MIDLNELIVVIDDLIRTKNAEIARREDKVRRSGKQPIDDPYYREMEGFRNGLICAKLAAKSCVQHPPV